jgi:hypothetical protein
MPGALLAPLRTGVEILFLLVGPNLHATCTWLQQAASCSYLCMHDTLLPAQATCLTVCVSLLHLATYEQLMLATSLCRFQTCPRGSQVH